MVIQWVIIALFVLAGLWFLKLEHHSKKVKVVIIVLIGAVIYFSMMNIFTSDQVDLTSPRGVVNGVYVYFGWIGRTASNLWDIGADTVSLVGNAVKVNNTDTDQPRR
jgi:hypothetical protein